MTPIAGNIREIRERVARAAEAAGRSPSAVRIIAVTKTKPASMIAEAFAAGLTDVGENYVQEAAGKRAALQVPLTWHMIGHLQRNKARRAVELFDVIQSVDSIELAAALQRHAANAGRTLPVLLEVNLGGEDTKSGIAPDGADRLLERLAAMDALSVRGLMTIPPPEPGEARAVFRGLRVLLDRLRCNAPPNASLEELSMGMTDDFEVAIAEGATMVRIGRAIFGERSQ